jgi:hypothetical protein
MFGEVGCDCFGGGRVLTNGGELCGEDVGAERVVHHVGFLVILESGGYRDDLIIARELEFELVANRKDETDDEQAGSECETGHLLTDGEFHVGRWSQVLSSGRSRREKRRCLR